METTNPKEVEISENELEEIQYEEADSYGEIIYAAYNAYSMADMIDDKLVSEEESQMLHDIKSKSLKLVHIAICNMYENNAEEEAI